MGEKETSSQPHEQNKIIFCSGLVHGKKKDTSNHNLLKTQFTWIYVTYLQPFGMMSEKQWISPQFRRNETQLASSLPCLGRHCGQRQQNKQANEQVRAKMNVCQINWRAVQQSGGEGRGKVVLKVNICTRWVLATCRGLRPLLIRKQTCYFTQA